MKAAFEVVNVIEVEGVVGRALDRDDPDLSLATRFDRQYGLLSGRSGARETASLV